jgi:hypothetical protein
MDGFPDRQWRLPLAGAKDDVGVGAVRRRELGKADAALDREVAELEGHRKAARNHNSMPRNMSK